MTEQEIRDMVIATGAGLAVGAASTRIFGTRGAFLVDMAFELKSCNQAAMEEHEAVMQFLEINFPDAFDEHKNLKKDQEYLYKEAKEFLQNAPRLEITIPRDPCEGQGGGSGASATGSCN